MRQDADYFRARRLLFEYIDNILTGFSISEFSFKKKFWKIFSSYELIEMV